ncbi:hypothetical protein A2U01_0110421, partial [Trifolium medium]|nr:hypothetical protein [Trifolium medium]
RANAMAGPGLEVGGREQSGRLMTLRESEMGSDFV